MLSKEEIKNDDFYRGYNERDRIAKEICKNCSYRNKVEELETKEQKLIEKLKNDSNEFRKQIKLDPTHNNATIGACGYAQEILNLLKGEKE